MRPLTKSEKQWLFPASTLRQTPSQDVGMSYVEELQTRAYTIVCIRSLARRTGLSSPQDPRIDNGGRARGVMTVAATLVHRFYMRRSIQDFPPYIMAPTILFIASKIEEEALKLRHIVNCCLQKFDNATDDKLWLPSGDHGFQADPSPDYRRWEEDILACEEVTHEALCFDMTVEQPWPVMQAGVAGLDKLWAGGAGPSGFGEVIDSGAVIPVDDPMEEAEDGEVQESSEEIRARNGLHPNGPREKAKVNEMAILHLGWTVMNELYLYPISILYHPTIIAFACFRISVQALLSEHGDVSVHLNALAPRFGLDSADSELAAGQSRSDMEIVEDCLGDIKELIRVDLKTEGNSHLQRIWDGYLLPAENPTPIQSRPLTPPPPTISPRAQTMAAKTP